MRFLDPKNDVAFKKILINNLVNSIWISEKEAKKTLKI